MSVEMRPITGRTHRAHRNSPCGRAAAPCLVLLLLAWWCADAAAGRLSLEGAAIFDSASRKIVVTQPFQRIIALYGAHTENLFHLGAGHQVIGVTRHAEGAASAKPVFSYHDDLEKFLAARPDLVIVRPMIDRGYSRLLNRLEDHGITVVSLQPGSIEEMFIYWRILGALTGRIEDADAMVTRFRREVAEIARRTATLPQKKRVYFEAIHDRMRTFSPGSMPVFVVEAAGGVNVAGDAAARRGTNIADYGKERILAHAEEIDVYLAQVGPMNQPTLAAIKSEPGFELIRAVRNDQIFLVDETLVARPTMRLLEGIEWISRILYPRLDETEIQSSTPPSGNAGGRHSSITGGFK